jgi:hypothetical protein
MADQSEQALHAAIEGLYVTFSRYGAEHVDGCPHCVSDANHARLHSRALRDLAAEDLDRYAFKAMTTWGDSEDYRHFLPRMLELLARHGDQGCIELDMIFHKLEYGGWSAWPAAEQEAIAAFFDALWSHVLARYPHVLSTKACLYGVGQTREDLAGHLAAWRIAQSRPAAKHFASFLGSHAVHRSRRRRGLKLDGPGWKDRPTPAHQVVQWLADPLRKAELEQAFFAFGDNDEDAAMLSRALDDLADLGLV